MTCTYQKHGKVKITKHALKRLNERVGNYGAHNNWNEFVQAVRYRGTHYANMPAEEKAWCDRSISRAYSSSRIISHDGCAYIFMGDGGHARTLVTVIKMRLGGE